jgi:hypothetical protein
LFVLEFGRFTFRQGQGVGPQVDREAPLLPLHALTVPINQFQEILRPRLVLTPVDRALPALPGLPPPLIRHLDALLPIAGSVTTNHDEETST